MRITTVWLLIVLALAALQAPAATYAIKYRLAKAGPVSLNVYDANGALVRELLRATPQPAGEQTLIWDGLDRDGNSVVPGAYSWKLLQTQGLKSQFLLSLGSNYPIGPDWRNASGPGTHGSPFGIAVDPTGIYISANTTENIETCSLKLSPDGKTRLWNNLHPNAWDGAQSLALDGKELFMLGKVNPQRIFVYNAQTGAMARNLDVRWDAQKTDCDGSDMDSYAGVLVVVYAKQNTIRWYNVTTGALLDSATVPAPQGITVGAEGVVYLTTADKVVKLTQADHTVREVATGLISPGRMDVDHGSGEILVFQGDASQQIVRLAPNGTVVKTYGAAGGRRDGLYTAETKKSFNGFGDLCADGAGGMYFTEWASAPRRVAQLNAEGEVLREWYGGQRWAPHAQPEPDNPNVVWVGSQYGWIMRCIIDYANKTFTVHSTYAYPGLANGMVGDSWNEGCYFRVYKHDGATYLVLEKMAAIMKVDEKNWKLLPATICGNVGNASQDIKNWAAGKPSFQWNDADGDGLPQQPEVTYYAAGMPGFVQPAIDSDFTAFAPSDKMLTYKVTSWTAAGAPVYGTMPAGEVYGEYPLRFGGGFYHDPRWSAFIYHDPASKRLYGALNNGTTGWCSSVDSVLQTWDAKKALSWAVSEQGSNPGQINHNLRGIAGIAHGCAVVIDVNGGWNMSSLAQTYVWDADGLFVGGIMDHPDTNGIPNYMYQLSGELCHSAVTTLPDGDVYFYGNWENEVRAYRVTGWNDWVRKAGTLTVAAPSTAHTGQGLTAEYFDNTTFTDLRTVKVDGPLAKAWPAKKIPEGTALTAPDNFSVRWRGMVRPSYGPSFSGGWSYQNDKESFEGGLHAARDMKCNMSVVFKGSSVSLFGRTAPNGGYAKISIDGEFKQQIDYYSEKQTPNVNLFQVDGLAAGDHTLTLEVVGWMAPRNPKASDAWVTVDKIVADGLEIDSTGIPYTFHMQTNERVQVWLNGSPIIDDSMVKATASEASSTPIRLLRVPYPIQVNYLRGTGAGTMALSWACPGMPRQVIPAESLFPQTLGEPQVSSESGCAYLTTDTTTQGSWKGVYGKDGYNLFTDAVSHPAYAKVSPAGHFGHRWGVTKDVRGLQMQTGDDRIAACWGTNGSMTIDVDLTDGRWHQVGLYALDWDNGGRKVRVEVLNATGKEVLDTREIANYANGTYLVWNLQGHTKLRVTKLGGVNGIVSGLFFDSPAGDMPTGRQVLVLSANGETIADGCNVVSASANTDFVRVAVGTASDRTFTITNLGGQPLNLTGKPLVTLAGAQAKEFVIIKQPTGTILPGASVTFTVRCRPKAAGIRSARLLIRNDSDETPYDIAIQAEGVKAAAK